MSTDEYSIHQARQFHSYAVERINTEAGRGVNMGLIVAVSQLAIAVEYLIESAEKYV